ncbi:MAG: COG1470 family protein [Myxococcaceae bacterium]
MLVASTLLLGTARAEHIHVARPIRAEGAALRSAVPVESGLLRAAGTSPECAAPSGPVPCRVEMKYFGGPVISNVKVYAVLWDGTVNAEVAQGIGDFYRAFTSSEFFDWLTEYSSTGIVEVGTNAGQPGPGQIIGRGTFAGTVRLPALSTTYAACKNLPTLTCLNDTAIATELQWQVAHGVLLPPDANTLYVVHLPATVRVDDARTGLGVSCRDYCAYHSTGQRSGQTFTYAVIPDLGSNGCERGCGSGTLFENTCAASSHEVAEAVTDAAIGLAANLDVPVGWYDVGVPSQGEIGDMCNQRTDTLGSDGLVGCTAETPGCFTIQQSFSRAVWDSDPSAQPGAPACVSARYAPSGDFALTFKPNSLKVAAGETSAPIPVRTAITQVPPGGAGLPLVLSASDVPPGLHVRFDTTAIEAGESTTLTVSADANASLQTDAVLAIRATGAQTHSAAILVQVLAVPNDWSLTLAPATGSLTPGGSRTYTVTGLVTSGQPEPVALARTVSGLPTGVTAAFDRVTITPGSTSATLTLSASKAATVVGPTVFTITGTSGGQPAGHTATAQVQIDAPGSKAGGCTAAPGGGELQAWLLVVVAGALLARPRATGRA